MTEEVSDIENYFENYSLFTYRKGQILISNGEVPGHIYYLLTGRVKVYDVSYRGDEIVLHTYAGSEVFPIVHMIHEKANSYIYEADTDITIKRAPIKVMKKIFRNNPALTTHMLKKAYDYIDTMLSKQVLLMAGSARSKLIYELVIHCRQFGQRAEDSSYTLDVSEKDLGARMGLSRETVNRETKKLKQENIIRFDRQSIVIQDLDKLEAKLGHAI